jgi:signal-transduction protein with cAMP-binding, CBS, and nucleotidyltransferase domain
MSAGSICSRVMATAWPNESIRVAAQRMSQNGVGTLVVVEADGASRALGIVTDRDITTRCVAAGIDPATTPVSRIMTAQVHMVDEETPIEDAVSRMATVGTRRLVVTGHRQAPVGILSLDDVLDLFTQEGASIGRLLEKQRPHIPV